MLVAVGDGGKVGRVHWIGGRAVQLEIMNLVVELEQEDDGRIANFHSTTLGRWVC